MYFRALLLPLLLSSCEGFWFLSNDRTQTATANDRPVDSTCLANIATGNCAFYTCFEQRLPCGREGYITRHGAYYCNRMAGAKSTFDAQGQAFLDNAQRCMMTRLREYYSKDYFDCHDMEHEAVANVTACFLENDFCTVFRANHQKFWNVFELRDLFSTGANKIWHAVMNLSVRCSQEFFSHSINNMNQQLHNTNNALMDSLSDTRDNLADHLSDARDNLADHLGDTHSSFMDSFRQTRDRVQGSISSLMETLTGSDE